MKQKKRSFFLFWALGLVLPALLAVLFQVLQGNKALMGRWVKEVMAPLEQALARFWALFPGFSAAEVLTALALAVCVFWVIRAAVLLVLQRKPDGFFRRALALLSAVLWLWCTFCWLWNAAYRAPTFQEKSGLEVQPYSVETLERVTTRFAQEAAKYSVQVARDENGRYAGNREELFSRGVTVYENLAQEFPCLALKDSTRAKPIFFSRLQSILGFTGVYFPFTGEANVNIDAPLCLLPATIAHEMAHQRMVASEQEANFVGIAAAVTSGDPDYQYSGYLMGLIHLCNALSPVDREGWRTIVRTCFTPELTTDWNDNNAYWAALSSPVEDTAEGVYDSFLKGNGQELGMQSYGACVDLLVARFA